jgi:hypothetical protein
MCVCWFDVTLYHGHTDAHAAPGRGSGAGRAATARRDCRVWCVGGGPRAPRRPGPGLTLTPIPYGRPLVGYLVV